jgi:PKD domain
LRRLGLALLALAAFAFAPGVAGSALAAECEVDLRDGGGYLFDLEVDEGGTFERHFGYGDLSDGGLLASDAWDDWGNVFVTPPGADLEQLTVDEMYHGPNDCQLALGDQEVRFPVLPLKGLGVQHTVFADPGPLNGARLLTTLRNPGGAPVSVTLVQGDPIGESGNLGSDGITFPAATSDGTGIATPTSTWGVTSNGEPLPGATSDRDPALAHVWDGPGGAQRISRVAMEEGNDALFWTWDVTVPPGGVVSFISYEIQQEAPGRLLTDEVAAAVQQAEARQAQSFASLYQGMSAEEIGGTMNWRRPPAPTAAIRPVANATAATPVVLDGSASSSAPVPGLPQCMGIISYAWRTDDGASGSTPMLSHTFAPGPHKATLTVTGCGGSATAETSFMVSPASKKDALLKLLKVKLNRSKGTATVKVKALAAGTLTLTGKGVAKVAKKLRRPGIATLLVKPTGTVRKRLLARGEAKAKIVVSLKPTSGPAATLRKTLPLKLGD